MKKAINKKFTLVELLVAMAVFSILLLVSMQIFGASQRLWVNSEQKNNAFASARAAMEFITSRIQTCAYTDGMPFEISVPSDKSTMFFPTAMPMNRKYKSGEEWKERDIFSLRFVGFAVNEDGVLRMHIFSDEKDDLFMRNMPPYRRNSSGYTTASNNVKAKTIGRRNDAYESDGYNVVEIAENVTSFRLIGYDSNVALQSGNLTTPPYLLVIQLSVIDSKANFDKWKELAAGSDEREEIFQEHGYTFQRAVLIRQRRAK